LFILDFPPDKYREVIESTTTIQVKSKIKLVPLSTYNSQAFMVIVQISRNIILTVILFICLTMSKFPIRTLQFTH